MRLLSFPPSLLRIGCSGSGHAGSLLPLLLVVTHSLAESSLPRRHVLFFGALGFAIVAVVYSLRARFWGGGCPGRRRWAFGAAGLFTAARICESVARDREGVWRYRVVLPLVLYVLRQALAVGPAFNVGLPYASASSASENAEQVGDKTATFDRRIQLFTLTLSGWLASSTSYTRDEVVILALVATVLTAGALIALEEALAPVSSFSAADVKEKERLRSASNASHTATAPVDADVLELDLRIAARDSAGLAAVLHLASSFLFEASRPGVFSIPPDLRRFDNWDSLWVPKQILQQLGLDLRSVVLEAAKYILVFALTRRTNSTRVAILSLSSLIFAHVYAFPSLGHVSMTIIYAISAALFSGDPSAIAFLSRGQSNMTRKMRRLTAILAGLAIVGLLWIFEHRRAGPHRIPLVFHKFPVDPPIEALGPVKITDTTTHPVDQLIKHADAEFGKLLASQSKSLKEATAEYRKRYGIPPPPKFDAWYEFAVRRGVKLIDEFDTIHHSLLPFWALKPQLIRSRVTEAVGFDNFFLTVKIRDGQVEYMESGPDWIRDALKDMMEGFVQHLPDMDLAFNLHDEPRVVVPHDILDQLLVQAHTNRAAIQRASTPLSSFSPRPTDVSLGKKLPVVKTTRFNRFAHQNTWSHSKASCPPDSPARSFNDVPLDNITSFALGNLGFVYNQTAFTDICHSPSLQQRFGFFDRPNAFDIVQDLFPVFSQSKVSSFQDILFPSPWYWANKVEYQADKDIDWTKKESKLYWRGSTTGGFSRNGGWRRQHRQRMVRKINDRGSAKIMRNAGPEGGVGQWDVIEVPRQDFKEIIDVAFSHVGQCDPDDCDAQKEFFHVGDRVDQQDAWKARYLLDMDGNAFSGRFYAFLRSNSLVYKMAVFQEWHMEWLQPWLHYIPFSLIGDEWLEAVRWFAGEPEGKVQGPRLAKVSQEWAGKALRREDMEAWFFRLLLEYGRIVDDNRDKIGYADR